jgi:hypothetical protein
MGHSTYYLTTLREALERGDSEAASGFLRSHPDIPVFKDVFDDGKTLLHRAAEQDYKAVAEFLIASGADVNARDGSKRTPLYLAAESGRRDLVELLLANGADVNASANFCVTPFRVAIRNGHSAIQEILTAHGADAEKEHHAERRLKESQVRLRDAQTASAWKTIATGAGLLIGGPLFAFLVATWFRSAPALIRAAFFPTKSEFPPGAVGLAGLAFLCIWVGAKAILKGIKELL